jgi:hypothetical protein
MLCYNFTLQALCQSAQHLYEKREGSGARSGFIPLTNGSGSGRPKNIWIRRIRIHNTGLCPLSGSNEPDLLQKFCRSRFSYTAENSATRQHLTSPVAGEAMPDPHVQPPGNRLRVQEVAHPAQEAAHEEGDPGLGQGGQGQRQGNLPRLRQAQQHDRYAGVFYIVKRLFREIFTVLRFRDVNKAGLVYRQASLVLRTHPLPPYLI